MRYLREKWFWYVVGGSIILIAAAASLGYYLSGRVTEPEARESEMLVAHTGPQSLTRKEVPPGVEVPERDSDTSAKIAKPETVAIAGPNTDSKKRSFTITFDGSRFSPQTVIVRKGDIAHIVFAAYGKPYDVVQPDYYLQTTIGAQANGMIESGFWNVGAYTFYCERCGGLEKSPKGTIMVVP